jgi:hypothetical protein
VADPCAGFALLPSAFPMLASFSYCYSPLAYSHHTFSCCKIDASISTTIVFLLRVECVRLKNSVARVTAGENVHSVKNTIECMRTYNGHYVHPEYPNCKPSQHCTMRLKNRVFACPGGPTNRICTGSFDIKDLEMVRLMPSYPTMLSKICACLIDNLSTFPIKSVDSI